MTELRLEGEGASGSWELGERAWWAADLRAVGVIEGLERLLEAEETGRLDVQAGGVKRSLYVESGEFVGGASEHPADRLGQVLWRSGRISLDQLMIANATREPGKKIGRALVDQGYLEPKELRESLWTQARAVLEAACLETRGVLCFVRDVRSENPIRWGVPTIQLLGENAAAFEEVAGLLERAAPLSAPCQPKIPAPSGALDEPAEALLQLAMSGRRKQLTRADLLDKAELGTLIGLRALARLVEGGYFEPTEAEAEAAAPEVSRVRRLCEAVNLVMSALEFAGGPGEAVQSFLNDPPEHLEEVLSGISLDEHLDAEALELQATFAEGGVERMERALVTLLDYALFEARDALEDEAADALEARIEDLDVFG